MTQEPGRPRRAPPAWQPQALLVCILVATLGFHLWGIRRDLPYITEDPAFVEAAGRIAASGHLNPKWFGHPGSTLIYPLAAVFHAWNALVHSGRWFHPDPHLGARYRSNRAEFFLLGRLLTVVYAILSVPVIYRIGQHSFGTSVALIGALFTALYPTEIFDKIVRTDSASVFFAMLALWRCLRLHERPSAANQLWAGTAIGVAIGTKYYLGTLIPVLAVIDALVLRRTIRGQLDVRTVWRGIGLGCLAVPLAFALSTPYFFLDYATAATNLKTELSASAHEDAAAGFSPLGNLLWYVTSALPVLVHWPQMVAAAAGLAVAIRVRSAQQGLLLLFALIFLAGISFSALHWQRWIIPVLPVFALFAALGLHAMVRRASRFVGLPPALHVLLLVVMVAVAAAPPTLQLIAADRLHATPSTNVLARQWVDNNVPPQSRVAFEWETLPPPLKSRRLSRGLWINRDLDRNSVELSMSKLAVRRSLAAYTQDGYRYLITNGATHDYFTANADRYPAEAAFYRELVGSAELLHEVRPSATRRGSTIRIYAIR